MKEQNTLETYNSMPVSQAVVRNAIPAMAAMLMTLIYNLADTFFIGQTHNAYQLAAVSLASPVFLIFMSVGMIFGIGGTSAISRAVGEGRKDHAKKISSFCMWSCVFVGIITSCISLLFMDNILALVGASADTWDFAKDYLTIVSYGGVFVLISNCFSNILRAEGQATKAMLGQIIGNLLNVIFDPVMILGFGWDIKGAAIATLIGNFAAALYYVLHFMKGKSSLSIHIKDFSYKDKICSSVLSIGIPASLASLLMSVSHIILNGTMAGYGDMAVAGAGVAMKVTMISGMLTIGIGQGVQPLLGFCVGAKKWDRYNKLIKFSLFFAFAVSFVMTVLCYLFTNQIVSAFITDVSAFDYAVSFSRILLTTSIFFGIFYVLTNAIQAMGSVIPALIINLSRQGMIYIPALYILNIFSNAGVLMFAQPIADILSIILAAVLYVNAYKKLSRQKI
ncbi:MAG: MATE family efflux transporter [Eubacterium sp.]|nr:MATE family efflux transporter [Eubacterium sp.]